MPTAETDSPETEILQASPEKEKPLHFDPIDARFLSSLPLVQGRISRLLKCSKYGLHKYLNLLIAIVSLFSHFSSVHDLKIVFSVGVR